LNVFKSIMPIEVGDGVPGQGLDRVFGIERFDDGAVDPDGRQVADPRRGTQLDEDI
jgi:hypothetical protein